MAFEITTNAREYGARLREFPTLLDKHITPAVRSALDQFNRTARRNIRANDAMAHSVLINSIQTGIDPSGLEGIVSAGADYARYVEEGTGSGGYPPRQIIIDWLRVRQIEPRDPGMTEDELAYLISRRIAMTGTPAKPFMRPAFESEKDAAMDRVNAGVAAAIAELGR